MKIKIDIPGKFEEPLNCVVSKLCDANSNPGLTPDEVLTAVCKQYIAQEYGKYLME